jgi:hypothetical protein
MCHDTSSLQHLVHTLITSPQMSTMTDHNNQRQNGYSRANMGYGNANMGYGNQYGGRGQVGGAYGMHHSPSDMSALAHSFQGMNIANQPFAAQNKNTMMPATGGQFGGMPVAANMPYGVTGQYMYPNAYGPTAAQSPGMYTPHASQYAQPLNYQGYQQHDNSPMSHNWTPTTAGATGDVPTLITPRRDSISSNENDQPATPSYAGYPGFVHGNVSINRSPSGVFSHSTPSPTSMVGPYGMTAPKQQLEQADVSPRLKLLMAQEPAIPRAIPAPSSPLKPLDRALENQRGETNVYIRGLLPETTDENLEAWGSRFGDIKSSKSIIDLNTGLCKGYVCHPTSHFHDIVLTPLQLWLRQVPQLRRRRELHPWLPLPWLRSQLCKGESHSSLPTKHHVTDP